MDDRAPSLRVAVTGASGLIGSAVVERLRRAGHQVIRMVRREPRAADEARWDPASGAVDAARLDGVHGVVHLAGESIAERWTPEAKARIAARADTTRALATALAALPTPPAVLVTASAVGIYGRDRGDEVLTEESAHGDDFLARVGEGWEGATAPAAAAGVRVVMLRFGVVLSARGGALGRMLLPFRLGLGGRVGSGRQWMSWIGRADVAELALRALTDAEMRGAYNAMAGAVTNAEFTRTLGRVLHRPTLLPVPVPALDLLFGSEMVRATLLASQRGDPARLRALGHRFLHPDLGGALRAALEE